MEKLQYIVYLVVRWIIWLCYPKTEVIGTENLPQEPCLIVGNHSQMHGPIVGELYFPGKKAIWCAGEMMALKEVPAYAYQDFWSRKPKAVRPFFKLASYVIAPLSVCIFNHAHTIPVYRDKRVIHTFRKTTEALMDGANVIVFPEHDAPHDHILCDFQDGFVSVARDYYRQTGKALTFVPMYLAPSLHKAYLGKPVVFDPDAPIRHERRRICDALMETISATACALPRHRVVPYNNVSKKEYGYNTPEEVTEHEKAGY